MRSTFGQLLKYARSDKREAIEDFSTEALAAALRTDFRPILPLLRERALIDWQLEPTAAEIYTQKPVRGGRVDLAMTFVGPGWSHEVWLEVKVGAGVHGEQMDTYRRAIDERGPDLRTELAFLLKGPFLGHPDVERIWWREIRDVARAMPPTAVLWRDLATYLEEVRVTDPYDDPVEPTEAGAMLDAAALLRKMRRVLRRTARKAHGRWPQLGFPDKKGVADRFVESQFADRARLTIGTRGARANILFGIAQRDIESGFDEGEPQLVVWVEHPPNLTDVRRRLISVADAESGLTPEWIRSWKGYWALRRQVRLSERTDQELMEAWWWDRLEELEKAGVIGLIPRLGAPIAEELDQTDDEELDDAHPDA